MKAIELGALLVGGSLLLLVALVSPWVLLATAAAGVALVLYGWHSGEELGSLASRRRRTPRSASDLVECPDCGALEARDRSACRFCEGSLANVDPE